MLELTEKLVLCQQERWRLEKRIAEVEAGLTDESRSDRRLLYERQILIDELKSHLVALLEAGEPLAKLSQHVLPEMPDGASLTWMLTAGQLRAFAVAMDSARRWKAEGRGE